MTDSEPSELPCREAVELVTDYLGDLLPTEELVRLEQHLADCPPCTAYLAQMRSTRDLAAGLGKTAPSAEEVERLLELFRRWSKQ